MGGGFRSRAKVGFRATVAPILPLGTKRWEKRENRTMRGSWVGGV